MLAPVRHLVSARPALPTKGVRRPNSYWVPLVSMVASLLFAIYAVVPRSIFGAFASDNQMYTVSITSGEGAFSVTLTGDNTVDINLAGDEAVKSVDAEKGTVTYDLTLASELNCFDISSRKPISRLSFGEGAEAVAAIDASGSGLASLDVSRCAALEDLNVTECPIESALLEIAYDEHEGQNVRIGAPGFSYNDSGVLFTLTGFGEDSELTVSRNQKPLKAVEGQYCIPYAELKEALKDDGIGSASVEIVNAAQPGLVYSFVITLRNVSDSDVLNPQEEESASGGSDTQGGNNADQGGNNADQGGNNANQGGNNANQGGNNANQGGNNANQGGNNADQGGSDDTQGGNSADQDGSDTQGVASESNSTALTVDDSSKSIILSAKAHDGTVFTVDGTEQEASQIKIVAAAASDESKNEFIADIKKADKNFNAQDKNLMVYDVYVVNTDGTKAVINGKVDFTLAYPNDTVKKNYTKYTFGVYHQKADKSIDTQQKAVGGKDGITVTTDGFSLFAVTSLQNSDNPKTGDAAVALNIAFLLAMLSMVSFAAVYVKNKAALY